MSPLDGQQVLFVIARHGYREEELELPRQSLEAAGARVVLASSGLEPARGMGGGTAFPELLYCAARAGDYAGIVFVGGTGASEYFTDVTAHRLAQAAVRTGKVVGAICFAGSILANAGILEGRRATAFPSREAHLRERGAVWTGEPVTRDGNVVSGRGPEDAGVFAQALVDALSESVGVTR